MVPAVHSGSDTMGAEEVRYFGEPGGFVIELENGFRVYHSGDTTVFGDMTLIRYTTQDEMSYIMLAQFPEGTSINLEEMLRLMEEGTGDPNNVWYSTDTKIIEQKPVTVRGQETTLNISDGTSLQELSYRYATARFEGRGGPALVMVASPVDEWDLGMVDGFISSIQ